MASRMTVTELRSLVAARTAARPRPPGGAVLTGVPALDDALGGGLPAGQLTELVSATPSSGGQSILEHLLLTTRAARQRVALIDGADGFVPSSAPSDALRHLVWIRAGGIDPAFAAADILVRDGNYAVVVLDLRGLNERALLRQPATLWHRLHHAAAASAPAVLVQTATPLVPSVPWRLVLNASRTLSELDEPRAHLVGQLSCAVARGHVSIADELTG
ncbi:MAG TPA: hypothetical protein VHD32_11435 [Candidatus Didemnitutus sp.]|nr:hypothetical protein [Candidatus Didemnitutus sp.]